MTTLSSCIIRFLSRNAGVRLACIFAAALIAGSNASADSLRFGEGVVRSRNQDLVFHRFGYSEEKYAVKRRPLPHRPWLNHSELRGYHLDDPARSIEEELQESVLLEEAKIDERSFAQRFSDMAQEASDTLVGGLALALKQYFGGEDAFAASADELEDAAEPERDALVHF